MEPSDPAVDQTLQDPYKARALEGCKHPMPAEKPAGSDADATSTA